MPDDTGLRGLPLDEQTHLAECKANVAELNEACIDMCRILLRMDTDQLSHSGHKSIEAAVLYTVKDTIKSIEKIWNEHIRRFPD